MVKLTTYVDGSPVYFGDSFEDAASAWDGATFKAGRSIPGGISRQEFDSAGNMVVDGWLFHVHEDGTVYVNPRSLAIR